jgi:hypothetical protein
MKLALSSAEGISVLTGTGQVSVHDLDVLRAGLTKLLKSGRNRIVLELSEAEMIPDGLIRELSKFDMLARELSGRVILAGNNEKLQKRVVQFAEPPVIECFNGKDAALKYFREKDKPATTPAPPPAVAAAAVAATKSAAPAAPAGSAQTPPTATGAQGPAPGTDPAAAIDPKQAFKTAVRQKELTEATDLRKRIADLENENTLLAKQLHTAWLASRTAPTQTAQQAELETLRQRMEEILEQGKASQAK